MAFCYSSWKCLYPNLYRYFQIAVVLKDDNESNLFNILFVSMEINHQLLPIRIDERIGKRGLPIKGNFIFYCKRVTSRNTIRIRFT